MVHGARAPDRGAQRAGVARAHAGHDRGGGRRRARPGRRGLSPGDLGHLAVRRQRRGRHAQRTREHVQLGGVQAAHEEGMYMPLIDPNLL